MKLIPLSLAVVLSAGVAAGAAEEPNQDDKPVLVITTLDEIPARSHRALEQPLEELPEGYRLQVTIDRFYDFGQTNSSNRFEPYVASYVPLNSQGNKDGQQCFLSQSNRVYRIVPWDNAVKNGTEQVFNEYPRYLTDEIPWKNGVLEGVLKTYYDDGSLRSETPYVGGQPHGVVKSYAKDGKVTRKCTMKNGKRHGRLVDTWPQTGETRRIIRYDMGDVTGVVKEFHANGQLKRQIPFVNNVMHGEEKVYEEDGTPAPSRYWIGGDRVSKTEFELSKKGR
jgi:antitoxin component YwqK of YwqJK toxin-antitoxin module